MSTKPTPPEIKSIKFSELVIDPIYSGRDEKEITANSKELAPQFTDGWDVTQPGQYFIGDDGKKHLVAGFTRVEAAKSVGLKCGYFVKSDGSEVYHLTSCLRTNGGKPISRVAQGELFISLRDGAVADDFKFGIAEKDEDWKRKPMTLEEIAALPGVGKSTEHIKQCILVAEDPVFAESQDAISVNAFVSARNLVNKHHEGNEMKLRKVVAAALAEANRDGKDKATPKHFDAIKAQFIPEKKLVAAPVNGDTEPAIEREEKHEAPAETPTIYDTPATEAAALFDTKPESKKPSKKADADFRKGLETLILEASEEYCWAASDEDISGLADKVEAYYAKREEVF